MVWLPLVRPWSSARRPMPTNAGPIQSNARRCSSGPYHPSCPWSRSEDRHPEQPGRRSSRAVPRGARHGRPDALEQSPRRPGAFPPAPRRRASLPVSSEEGASRSAGRASRLRSDNEASNRAKPVTDLPPSCGQARRTPSGLPGSSTADSTREPAAVRLLSLRCPRCGLPPPRRSAFAVFHDPDGLTFHAPSDVFQPVTFMGFGVLQEDP